MPLNNFAETIPIIFAQVWLPADGTNVKVIAPSQPTIYRLDTLLAVNDDNVAHVFTLTLVDPASALHGIGSVSIPALAGHAPNPQLDIFAALFPATQVGIAVPAGWILQAFLAVGATSAVGAFAIGGYF
jgi:hypothetical protein